jgi:hypothetical protein
MAWVESTVQMIRKSVGKALQEMKSYDRDPYMVKDKIEEILMLLSDRAVHHSDCFLIKIDRWSRDLNDYARAFLPPKDRESYISSMNHDIQLLTETAHNIIQSALEEFEIRSAKKAYAA